MKKLILIIAAIVFSIHNYGQAYHSLPVSNAKWCIEYNNHVIPPPTWWYTNYWETYYSGDTIIQNKSFTKIERTEYDIYCLNTVVNGPEYIGAIREDTIQKQVFFVPNGESEENLIYDFNLSVGDTLFSYLNFYQPLIVEQVDSILINESYNKRIRFQFDEAEIIEGIGSRTGLIEELVAFEGGSYLCAFYVDTTFIFPDYPCNLSATDTCLILNIEPQYENPDISIFPNPTHSIFNFESSELLVLELNIYNKHGQKILTELHPDKMIDISAINQGLYIVEFVTSKSRFKRKLIIQ